MMEHLQQLLATENSQISQLLKLSLYGLQATLKQARIEYPNDPGNNVCENVILEIDNLLQQNFLQPEPILENVENNIILDQSKPEQLLNELREVFNTDLELNFYLGNTPLQSQNDSDLWNEIHRKLLRVPEDLATTWKKRALEVAQKFGAKEDYLNLEHLPFVRDEIIYPGLNGTIETTGLCLSKKAFLKLELASLYNSEDLQLLAGFVSLYIKFMEIETDLYHALKSVFSFDVVALKSQPEQRQVYLEALSDRLQRTQKTEENTDSIVNLRAWIDIDEAIHSLVFVPPAERYSWWGKLQQESRRILKKVANKAIKAGHDIRIKQLYL